MIAKPSSAPGSIGGLSNRIAARLLTSLIAVCFALPLAAATPSNVVNTRVDAMDRMAIALKTFLGRNVAQAGKVSLRKNAATLDATAARLLPLFPPGSGNGQTHARSEIWTNWPAFVARASDLQREADKLKQVVETGGLAQTTSQARVVSQACGACHQDFRSAY